MLLGAGFRAGFVVDGLEERAFPRDTKQRNQVQYGSEKTDLTRLCPPC